MWAWTDNSALWQAQHGQSGPRTQAAWEYIEYRLAGCSPELANKQITAKQEEGVD